ncbi:hypothetical protein [Streptomyces sp. NPDC005141]
MAVALVVGGRYGLSSGSVDGALPSPLAARLGAHFLRQQHADASISHRDRHGPTGSGAVDGTLFTGHGHCD